MNASNALDISALKREVMVAVDRRSDQLLAISHALHARPELAFRERFAMNTAADALGRAGLHVDRGAYGIPTALHATAGPPIAPVIICCEYDALPDIGHACGHNIIAAAGVGAGVALAPLARRLRRGLVVLGTPAEEGGGGKILLARRGAFTGALGVMLIHPANEDVLTPVLRAAAGYDVQFTGRAAHAAMAPEQGRNSLDAAVLAYQAIAALRAALSLGDHVNAVITTGGAAANVVPSSSVVKILIRAGCTQRLAGVLARVEDCCAAGARATGCGYRLTPTGLVYRELMHDDPLARNFGMNAGRLGRTLRPGSPAELTRAGSTDLGNVSHLAPAIHPKLAIAAPGIAQHTTAFARAAVSRRGDLAVLDGAKAMAMTAIDLWLHPRSPGSILIPRQPLEATA